MKRRLRFSILLALALPLPRWTAFCQSPDSSRQVSRPDLVEIANLDSTIHLDIRYASSRNFLGRPVYREPRAFLQRPAAEALLRVHRSLLRRGYGLLVFDGYRPWAVTKLFWDETPGEKRKYVANPSTGSVHNRGCAVDLSLYDRRTGKEVTMPSAYDTFASSASPRYAGGSLSERRMRDLLISAMGEEGFAVNPEEWWHFDYRDWRSYPVLNTPFEQIAPRGASTR